MPGVPYEASELVGGAFACLPGCGLCCTVSPAVRVDEVATLEAAGAGQHLVTRKDGTRGIRLRSGAGGKPGAACVALRADRACGLYEARPDACRVFPFHVHAGRRVQVSVNLACPGLWEHHRAAHAAVPATPLPEAASAVLDRLLARPDAAAVARRARENFREFDRRLESLGESGDERALAKAFRPALPAILSPEGLAGFYSGLAAGNLVAADAAELPFTDPVSDPVDFLAEVAEEAFGSDPAPLPQLADARFRWLSHHVPKDGRVTTLVHVDDGSTSPAGRPVAPEDLPLEWDDAARSEGEAYLALLTRRDHTGGAAARVMDEVGYRVTFASAYGRVLADAAALLLVRAGVAAALRGADEVGGEDARFAVAAEDMAFLSRPTLGAVL